MNGPIDLASIQRLAQSAHTALRQADADAARAPLQELAALLPRHPTIMSMRRWAAMIELEWPLTRDIVTLAPRQAPPPDAVDLVLFHADLPVAPSGVHKQIDYLAVAALALEGAAHRAPHARRILITDTRTQIPETIGAHEVIRTLIDPERLMYERMRVQEQYLAARPPDRATVFMDVDIVANRDPASIFAEDFDVGFTWRPEHPDAPINGGLIFVAPGERGLAFFQTARRCYDTLAADTRLAPLFERDLRAWWGDQFALVAMVGYGHFIAGQPRDIAVDGTRLRFFPCAEYNFTPNEKGSDQPEHLASRYFVHFKGNRKALLARYLDQIKETPR